MQASFRVIHADNSAVLFSETHEYKSPAHKFSQWLANDANKLQKEFDKGYQQLSSVVAEHTFGCSSKSIWCAPRHGEYCMLAPISPKDNDKFDLSNPTLQWEAFPRGIDSEGTGQNKVGKVNSVSYDLRIYEVINDSPSGWMYERSRLPFSYHKLEQNLKSDATYFWTVRASFMRKGQMQVTNWSYKMNPGAQSCYEKIIPKENYYRFSVQ